MVLALGLALAKPSLSLVTNVCLEHRCCSGWCVLLTWQHVLSGP